MTTTDRPRKAPRIVPGHRIAWFVYAGPAENGNLVRLRKTSNMRGWWPGYDAECECGWESRTGGAVKSHVEDLVREHKWDVTGDITHIFTRPA